MVEGWNFLNKVQANPDNVFIYTVLPRIEPVFVDRLRSPGIDSQPGGPVRKFYLTYRPARIHRLAESIPGLLQGLQIRALNNFSRLFILPVLKGLSHEIDFDNIAKN